MLIVPLQDVLLAGRSSRPLGQSSGIYSDFTKPTVFSALPQMWWDEVLEISAPSLIGGR